MDVGVTSPLFCRLAAMDPHFSCGGGTVGAQREPGLECLPPRVLNAAEQLLSGSTLVFVGDSTSLQMWLAALVLLAPRFQGLRCPDLSRAYRGEWGSDGRLRCAASSHPSVRLCYIKAGMVQRQQAAPRSSATQAVRELLRTGGLDNRSIVLVNAGLHYENLQPELFAEATALADLAAASRSSSAPAIVWRESSPQHFVSQHPFVRDGHPLWWADEWQQASAAGCSPASALVRRADGDKFNQVTSPILQASGMPILRVWNASFADWGGHLGRTRNREGARITDCTHFCLDTSPTVRSWVLGLLVMATARASMSTAEAAALGSAAVASAAARDGRSPGQQPQGSCKVPTSATVQLRLVRRTARPGMAGGAHGRGRQRMHATQMATSVQRLPRPVHSLAGRVTTV